MPGNTLAGALLVASSTCASSRATPTTLYDPADLMGKTFFNILATFAEFEVDLLRLRTREGMAVAQAKGKLKGKQPMLTAHQQAHLVEQHATGEHSIADLAELFSVGRAMVYRVLGRASHHLNAPRRSQ